MRVKISIFFGVKSTAALIAKRLGGTAVFPEPGDNTPNSAIVRVEINGTLLLIDFLNSVLGVDNELMKRDALTVTMKLPAGFGGNSLEFKVMHPFQCLQSRISNVIGPAMMRRDPIALAQLKAAPIVLERYLLETAQDSAQSEVCGTLKLLYGYLRADILGQKVHRETEIDPLSILVSFSANELIDQRFREHQLQTWVKEISSRRASREKRSSLG